MENEMMGLIFAENSEAGMGELTAERSLASVPFGGRYRIIDFVLSNMVNSSITNVGITTPYNYQSLSDHLSSGKPWDIDRKGNGLFLLPPKDMFESGKIRGEVDTINGVMHYLSRSSQDYVLVCDCNTICNIDFSEALRFHIDNSADITLIYTEIPMVCEKDLSTKILLDVDEESRVRDIQVYPTQQNTNNVYMSMFIIDKGLLMELVGDAAAHNMHYISKDILLPNLDMMRILGYKFDGYCRQINNVKNFYDVNLELLNKEVRTELFGEETDMPIYTKVKDTIPTKYGKNAEVKNSFIDDVCVIEGTVKNSILFRGVHIGRGAMVENCIVMQNSEVMENCLLENVVFDKEVVLRSGKKLVGQDTYPMVIGKKTVI